MRIVISSAIRRFAINCPTRDAKALTGDLFANGMRVREIFAEYVLRNRSHSLPSQTTGLWSDAQIGQFQVRMMRIWAPVAAMHDKFQSAAGPLYAPPAVLLLRPYFEFSGRALPPRARNAAPLRP